MRGEAQTEVIFFSLQCKCKIIENRREGKTERKIKRGKENKHKTQGKVTHTYTHT